MSLWNDKWDSDSAGYGLGSFNNDEDDLGIDKFLAPPTPRPFQPLNVPQPSEAPSVRYPDAIGPDGEITPPQLKQEYTSPMESLNVYDQLTDASKFQTLDSSRKGKHAKIWNDRLDDFKTKKLKPFYESFSDLMYEDATNGDDPDLENENYINQLDRGLSDLQTSAGEEDTWRGSSSGKKYAAGRLPDFDPWTAKNGLREQFIKLRDKAKGHQSTAAASKEKSELMEEQLFNIPTAQKVLLDADLSNRKKDETARFRDAAKAPTTSSRAELSYDKTNEMLDQMHFEDPDIRQGVLLNAGKIDPRTELDDSGPFSLGNMADQSVLDRRMSAARKGQDPSGVVNRRNLTQKNRRLFNQGIMFSHPNNTSDGLNPRELGKRDTDLLDLDRMRKAGMTEYNGKPLEEMLESLGGEERLYSAKILETVYQAKNNWQDAQLEYIAVAGSADAEDLRGKMMAAEELKNRTLVFAAKNGLDNELFDQAESIGWLSGLAQAAKTGWKLSEQANYSVDFLTNTLDADDQQKLIALNSTIASAPKSTSMERYQQATAKNPSKDLFHSISRLLFEHPDAASEMFVESMASFLPTTVKIAPFTTGAGAAIGAVLGRGKGAKFGAKWGAKLGAKLSWGVASLGLEVSGNTMQEMRELGINIKDPKIFAAAWANPVIREKITAQALKKGVPIAIMDSFNAIAAGKIAASFTKEGRELLTGGQLLNGKAWAKAQNAVPKFTRFQRGSAAGKEFVLGDQATGMFGEYWGQSWEKEPGEDYDTDAIAAEGVVGMGPGMAGGILNYVQSRPSQVDFVEAPFHYSDMRETAEGTTGKLERAGWVEDVQTFNTAEGMAGKLMEEGGHQPGDYGSMMTQDMLRRLYVGVGSKVMPNVRLVFSDKRTPQKGGQNQAGALQQDEEGNPVIYLNRQQWGESPFGVFMHESGHLARILMFPNDINQTDGKRQSSRLLDVYDQLPLAEKKDAWYKYRQFQGASDPSLTPEDKTSVERSFEDSTLKYRADEWFAFQWAQVVAGGTVNKGVKGELKTFYDTIIKDFAAEWMLDPTTGGLAADKGTKATVDTAVRSFILDKMGYDPMGIPQDKIVIDESSSATLTGPVYADDDVGLKRFIDDAQKEASASGIPVADLLKAVDALSGDTQTYDKWKETEAVAGSQYVEPQADLTEMLPTSAGSVEEEGVAVRGVEPEFDAQGAPLEDFTAKDRESLAATAKVRAEKQDQETAELRTEEQLKDEIKRGHKVPPMVKGGSATREELTPEQRKAHRAELIERKKAEKKAGEEAENPTLKTRLLKIGDQVKRVRLTKDELRAERVETHRRKLAGLPPKRLDSGSSSVSPLSLLARDDSKHKLAKSAKTGVPDPKTALKAAKRKKAEDRLKALEVKQDRKEFVSAYPPADEQAKDTLKRVLDTHPDRSSKTPSTAVKIEPSKETGKYELTTVRAGLGDVRRTTYDTAEEAKTAKTAFEKDESERVQRVHKTIEDTHAFVRDDTTFQAEAARVAKELGSDVKNVDRIKLGVAMMKLEELSKDSPWGIQSEASALYDDVKHEVTEKETVRRAERHANEFERISTTISNRIQALDRLMKPEEGLPRTDADFKKFEDEKLKLESIKESMAPERSTIDWKDIPHPLLAKLEKDNSLSPVTLGELAVSSKSTSRILTFEDYAKVGRNKHTLNDALKRGLIIQSNPQKSFSALIRDYTVDEKAKDSPVYPRGKGDKGYPAFEAYRDLTATDMRMYLDAAGAAELERSRGAVGSTEMGYPSRKSGKGVQPQIPAAKTGGFSIEAGTTLASMILYKLNSLDIGKTPQTTGRSSLEDSFLDLAHAPGEKIAPSRSKYGKAVMLRANSQGETAISIATKNIKALMQERSEGVSVKREKEIRKLILDQEKTVASVLSRNDPDELLISRESEDFAKVESGPVQAAFIEFRDKTSGVAGVNDEGSAWHQYLDYMYHDSAADATNTLKPDIDAYSFLGDLGGEDIHLSQQHPSEFRSKELAELIASKELTEEHGRDKDAKRATPTLGTIYNRMSMLKLALEKAGVETRKKSLPGHKERMRKMYNDQKDATVTVVTVGTRDYAITVEDTAKILADKSSDERAVILEDIHRLERLTKSVNALERINERKKKSRPSGLTLPERIGSKQIVPSERLLKGINLLAQKLAATKDEATRSKLLKDLVTLREKFNEVYKETPRNADLNAPVTARAGSHGKFKKGALVEAFDISEKPKKGKKHPVTHQMEQAERAVADITTARVNADGSTRQVINPEYAPHEGATVAIESATEAKDNVFTFIGGEWKAPPSWNVQRQQIVSAEEMLRISGMSLKDDSGKGISIKEDVPFTQNKYTAGHQDLQSDMAEQLEADQELAKEAWIDAQNKKYTGSLTYVDSVSIIDVVDFLMNPRNSTEDLDNPMSSQVKEGIQRQLPGPPGGGNLVRVWDTFIKFAYGKLGIDSKNSPKLPTPKDPHVWKHDRSSYIGGTEAGFEMAPEGEPNVDYNVMKGSIYDQPTPHPDVMRAQMVPLIQAAIDAGFVPIATLTGMSPDAESQITHSSDATQKNLVDTVKSPDGTLKQVNQGEPTGENIDPDGGFDFQGSDFDLTLGTKSNFKTVKSLPRKEDLKKETVGIYWKVPGKEEYLAENDWVQDEDSRLDAVELYRTVLIDYARSGAPYANALGNLAKAKALPRYKEDTAVVRKSMQKAPFNTPLHIAAGMKPHVSDLADIINESFEEAAEELGFLRYRKGAWDGKALGYTTPGPHPSFVTPGLQTKYEQEHSSQRYKAFIADLLANSSEIQGSDYNLENIQTSSLPADFGKLSALRTLVETFKKGGDKEYLKHLARKKGSLTEAIINQAAPIRKLTDMILDNSNLAPTHPMRDFINTHSSWHAYFGKGYAEVENAERRFVEPIINALRDHGIEVETFGEYLLARAAPTRNKHLKLRHNDELARLKKDITAEGKKTFNAFAKEAREHGVPFSGITDETAAAVVQDLENDANFLAFLNSNEKPLHKYYAMNKDALASKEQHGLIQGENGLNERARMEAAASYVDWASTTKDKTFSSQIDTGDSYAYAPMQGFEGETQDLYDRDTAFQALGKRTGSSGQGWDQSNRKLLAKGAFGRHLPKDGSGIYAPDPKAVMATTLEQFYNDKITSAKNEVSQSFGDLFTFMRHLADPEASFIKDAEKRAAYATLIDSRPEFKTLADSLDAETKAGISEEFSKIFKADFVMKKQSERYVTETRTPKDENGNELHRLRTVRSELDRNLSDNPNIFTYRVEGVPMYVEFNETPEGGNMAAAMQNLKYQALPDVLNIMNSATRYLAQTYTSMNPAFIIPNFFRDLGTAAVHLTEDHKSVIAKDIFSPSGMLQVGGFMKAVYSAERRKNKGESILSPDTTINTETAKDLLANGTKEQQYQFAMSAGAKVGYFRHDTVPEQIKVLQKKLKGEARLKQIAGSTLKLVDHMNTAVENSIRMSTFWSAIKNNYTVKQATDIARNVTVDFNQKGNLSQAFGSMYVFFGASMTSMNRLWTTFARRSPAQRAALVSGIVGAGMITSLFNRLMDPEEEDDDEPDYDSISSYKRDTNLIMPMPEGFPGNDKRDTGYFSVPVPLGYNMFWTLGQVMGDVLSSQMGLGNSTGVLEPMSRIMERSMNTFNPIGGSNFVSAGIPSAWMPIYELLGSNEDFMGNPIKYDDVSYSGKTPAHTRDPKGTPEHWTEASRWINEFMGGSETQKGSVTGMVGGNPLMYSEDHDIKFDMAGNQMKHLFYGYTGGIGKLLDQGFGGLLRASSGEAAFDDYGDVPIVGRFVRGTTYGSNTRSAFSSIRSAVKTAEASKRSAGDLGTAMANRHRIDNRALLSLSKDVKYMDALRKKIREMKAKIESRKDLSADRRDTLLDAAEEQELKAMIKIVKKARSLNFKA